MKPIKRPDATCKVMLGRLDHLNPSMTYQFPNLRAAKAFAGHKRGRRSVKVIDQWGRTVIDKKR